MKAETVAGEATAAGGDGTPEGGNAVPAPDPALRDTTTGGTPEDRAEDAAGVPGSGDGKRIAPGGDEPVQDAAAGGGESAPEDSDTDSDADADAPERADEGAPAGEAEADVEADVEASAGAEDPAELPSGDDESAAAGEAPREAAPAAGPSGTADDDDADDGEADGGAPAGPDAGSEAGAPRPAQDHAPDDAPANATEAEEADATDEPSSTTAAGTEPGDDAGDADDRDDANGAGDSDGADDPDDGTAAPEAGAGAGPDADAGTGTPDAAPAAPTAEDAPDDADEPAEEAGAATAAAADAPAGAAPGEGAAAGTSVRRTPSWAKPDAERGAPEPARDRTPDTASGGPREADAAAGPKGGKTGADRTGAGDESDAERTSTFVALKDPGRPAPVAVAARPVAEPPVVEPTREAPLPPLDLLAELTNTAPPPETTRRTLTRRVKVWTPILLLLAAAATGAQLMRPLPAPQLVAGSTTYTLEGTTSIPWPAKGQAAVRVPGSGEIGTFGEQKPMPTASVAKVMTAYVILKEHPLRKGEPGPRIEVDAKTVADGNSDDESRIEGLTAGTTFSQQDMLKMLMIPSANNIARLLARWDSGSDSTDAFVAKMNAAAKELGMNDTTYTDPSGLDSGTVSTAADQLKLGEAVMKEEVFRAIVALPSATIEGLPKPIENNNSSLLLSNGLSIKGIKTGSSTPAGGTLLWAAYKTVGDETPLILGAMMEQRVDGPDPNAFKALGLVKENSRKVIEAVRTALTSAPVIRKGQVVGHVSDGLGGSTPLVATKDLNVIAVPGQQLRLSLGPGTKPVPHEAKAGTAVGVLTVGEGAGAKSVPVAVERALTGPSFGTRVTRLS
ncbi:serine hydrolase [Streptomyces sp. NPDC006512]|uniref:D-alanyl-D-alanine carboxypeptidase n=1 Tax=Streptomyces sp. NPDC006512 TaxID=3154307 RepID=UPI0033B37444